MKTQRPFFPACGILAPVVLLLLPVGCATAPAASSSVTSQDLAATAYEPKMLDQQPTPMRRTRPQYPDEMRRAGISGQAVVEFIVDRDGNVQQVQAIGATDEAFARAAVQCVSQWKFSPGIKDGRPVATIMQMPITFQLGR